MTPISAELSTELAADKTPALEVRNVSISYNVMSATSIRLLFSRQKTIRRFEAVKKVSFAVDRGDILGIVGKNGSGKSTLLRAIAGVFSPNEGTIDLHGHTVSLMALGVGFVSNLTGRDNIILSGMLLGFSEAAMRDRMDDIIAFADIGEFIDMPVRTYSSGMHSKLSFAVTSMLETDIMLVDEVFSVGDARFKKKSAAKMHELIQDERRTVLIVSHDLGMLRKLCTHALWLHEGEVRGLGEAKAVIERYKAFMEG